MMDARSHGASEGQISTYGWRERNDTRAIVDTLLLSEVGHDADEQLKSGQGRLEPASETDWKPPPDPRPGSPLHIFALGESLGAGVALQSAAVEPRIEAVVAEASFANLRSFLRLCRAASLIPLLDKTLLALFSWMLLYRGEKLTGLPVAEVSPEKAVAARPFPVLLIGDEKDEALPCRHTLRIYAVARGPSNSGKSLGHFTLPHSAYNQPNSNAGSWNFFANVAQPKHVQ
jgi:hypothetical protein